MLVTTRPPDSTTRWWRRGAIACLLVLLVSALSLTPYLGNSTELVRMRNALLLEEDRGQSFDWTPDTLPSDFLQERAPASALFVHAADRLGLASMDSDWARVLAISRHLLSHQPLLGTPIQSDLGGTYQRILNEGTGYCGDFTRVFMAFAHTAGMAVRAWSFSFDGFGGHGHIWPEIWNRQRQQWELVDIFDNYYFTRNGGQPLSALELRSALRDAPQSLQLVPLVPGVRPGYEIEAKAWDYFQRGLPQWYLAWGNNVFSYDQATLVRTLGPVSRSLEQLGAIAQGAYPPIRILDDPANHDQVSALVGLRHHLLWAGGASALALLGLCGCLAGWALVHWHHPKSAQHG